MFTSTVSNEFLQQAFLNGTNNLQQQGDETSRDEDPRSLLLQPVMAQFDDLDSEIVGMAFAALPWYVYFEVVDMPGVVVVVENTCGEQFTYMLEEGGGVSNDDEVGE